MKKIFLICNAHLDPVWQWEWEEGLAEALSTFRIAAEFCEEFDGFVFNHNEAILYQWVEEYEPELFTRIQELVKQGRWHIMGGWYIQPDCNMPSGESMIRQITYGRDYFKEKFNKVPTTAINFDSFGHSRGLVQILKRAGYDSYIVGRPAACFFDPPAKDFCWVGYDGSEITTHLSDELYNTFLGKAVEKIEGYKNGNSDAEKLLVLWGIGNHGGGPSRIDLEKIEVLKDKLREEDYLLVHSTPEEYFAELPVSTFPKYEKPLNPVNVGCYTSQSHIKQKHRKLENMLYSTEKMMCAAEMQTGYQGNWDKVKEAEASLLFCEFHDILPGTTVKRAEEASLRSMEYAMELLSKERMKAFMAFASGVERKPPEYIPILVYNAHPYPVRRVVECEFQLQDQNRSGTYTNFEVYHKEKRIPSQLEKEDSNIPIDWRKKIIFEVEMEPFEITPVYCHPVILPKKPCITQSEELCICLGDEQVFVSIGRDTGLIEEFVWNGNAVLQEKTGQLLVIESGEDPWGMTVSEYRNVVGAFKLASSRHAGEIAGLSTELSPVRIIEDGEVRTVVEVIFEYEKSAAIVHYLFEKRSHNLQIKINLQWMQPNKMVKLSLKSAFSKSECFGQVMFGQEKTKPDGKETIFQKYLVLADEKSALSVVNNGVYAHDYRNDELRITLLHAPAYCAHPVDDLRILPDDRYMPRIDIGEHLFEFTLCAGEKGERFANIEREAQIENEKPFALSFYPSGKGKPAGKGMWLDNPSIIMSSCSKKGDNYLLRLYNSMSQKETVTVNIPVACVTATFEFMPFELKTILLEDGVFHEVLLDGA